MQKSQSDAFKMIVEERGDDQGYPLNAVSVVPHLNIRKLIRCITILKCQKRIGVNICCTFYFNICKKYYLKGARICYLWSLRNLLHMSFIDRVLLPCDVALFPYHIASTFQEQLLELLRRSLALKSLMQPRINFCYKCTSYNNDFRSVDQQVLYRRESFLYFLYFLSQRFR